MISTSAPHIYHSALPLSPQTSTIHKLYEPYACPLARVVQGIPISWEPVVATVQHHGSFFEAAWSPCSRYIAVSCEPTIKILDGVTLERLHTFKTQKPYGWLSFSPDSRLLTQFSDEVTTWDLQTGGRISTIPQASSRCFSSTYSVDGKMVAVAYGGTVSEGTGISTYNLLSGTHTYSHHVSNSEGRIVASIWTHDECFRFVVMKQSPSILTVWQVGFASIHTLTKVETLPGPGISMPSFTALFLPTRSRFAFCHLGIWDIQGSLFQEIPIVDPFGNMSFSSDGRFFMYKNLDTGIHLWEESPPGYVLRGQIGSGLRDHSSPHLSPNGKLIATSVSNEIHLWRTADPIASLSSAPTSLSSAPTRRNLPTQFLLDFSPDGSVAAAARQDDGVVTVIDLKSGNPRSIINTGMKIHGLRVAGNTIIVFDKERIVAWELSAGAHVLDARATINDAVRTITLSPPAPPSKYPHIVAISHDLNYIVALWWGDPFGPWPGYNLGIYDMSTGIHLVGTTAQRADTLWVTPDGCEVRCSTWEGDVGGWKIIKDGKSNVIRLEHLPENTRLPGRCPWESPHGYNVTYDGWILNSRKERVMWLPHRWRKLGKRDRKWDERFLGLSNWELPEPIIVELGE